jgi:hypothetical protein
MTIIGNICEIHLKADIKVEKALWRENLIKD